MNSVTTAPLGEIADVVRGVTFSKSEVTSHPTKGFLPVIRAGNIQDCLSLDKDLLYIPREKVNAEQILRSGDIIICTSSGSSEVVGKTAFAERDWEGTFGAFCAGIRANPEICDPIYLFYYLRSPAFRSWTRKSSGVSIKNIRKSELDLFEIPLPPLSEQRRIASILYKADSIWRKREETQVLVNDFLKSLFFKMFGDFELNILGWKTCTVADILKTDPQNGLYRPSGDYGSGTSILRIDGFYDGYLVKDRPLKRLKIDAKTTVKYRLENSDIVINRVNSREYLGKSALVEGLMDETVFESNMIRFRVDDVRINPRFFVDQLQTQFIKRQILRASKDAVNQSSINQTDVRNLEIRVPPIELQGKYVAIVDQKTKTDLRLSDALSASSDLFRSLSQRAFIGKL